MIGFSKLREQIQGLVERQIKLESEVQFLMKYCNDVDGRIERVRSRCESVRDKSMKVTEEHAILKQHLGIAIDDRRVVTDIKPLPSQQPETEKPTGVDAIRKEIITGIDEANKKLKEFGVTAVYPSLAYIVDGDVKL